MSLSNNNNNNNNNRTSNNSTTTTTNSITTKDNSSLTTSYNPSSSSLHEYSNHNDNDNTCQILMTQSSCRHHPCHLPFNENKDTPIMMSSSMTPLSSRHSHHTFENKLISMNHQIETFSSNHVFRDNDSLNPSRDAMNHLNTTTTTTTNFNDTQESSDMVSITVTTTSSNRRNTTTSPLTPSSLCTTPNSSRCNTPHVMTNQQQQDSCSMEGCSSNSSMDENVIFKYNDENGDEMTCGEINVHSISQRQEPTSSVVTSTLNNSPLSPPSIHGMLTIQKPEKEDDDGIYQPNLIINSHLSLSSMRVVRNREEILSPCVGKRFHTLSSADSNKDDEEEEQVDLIGSRDKKELESVDVKKRASDVDKASPSLINVTVTNSEEVVDDASTCNAMDNKASSSSLKNLVQKRVSICEPLHEEPPLESNWRRESMSEKRDTVKNDSHLENLAIPSATSEATNSNGKPFKFLQKRPSFINPQLVNILFASLLSLQDLKPSENQVAGHGQKDGEEHLVVRHLRDKIYKPINPKSKRAFDEVKFYETQAPKIPLLEPYLPKYYGVQTVQENDQQFLVLEDLTAPFINPSLLDIRMGRRVYGDDASPEKIKMFDEKYIYQKELGFSFSGMKVYNTTPNFASINTNPDITHKDGKYKVYNRYWGRNCKPGEESVKALEDFFFDTSYDNAEQVGLKSMTSMLSQLRHLEELFKTHQLIYRVYSSSLFLVFDDNKAIVRMIDFAHVHENKEPCVDENYLYGLSMLIYYFEQVLKRRSPNTTSCSCTNGGAVSESNNTQHTSTTI
ncbi:hypothetical protein FDP41_001003 [Naegleria fowleri]|uniref:Kinase n=1 Tax=Naegleria fowleri TaxID=5763 RepID=A0A6A5C1W9_NAEFO|nr:uncharacterized protein FDP41_001003 [Naegleria fowleri]KAF0979850.1 hypothetical protein FDP41_001003 [Naegleria fowleri]